MAEFVAFHPAIAVGVQILRTDLPAVGSGSDYPRTGAVHEFVRVDRVGGGQPNLVTDAPMLLLECWADSLGGAERLAVAKVAPTMKAAQWRSYQGVFVRWWKLAGIAHLDDPDKPGMSRFQVTGELALSHVR